MVSWYQAWYVVECEEESLSNTCMSKQNNLNDCSLVITNVGSM